MTSAAIFDAGPLSWVKGEIDLALDRVAQGLQQFGANTADLTQIKFCRTHLHQVRGALTIVGLDGVTQFTDALEALLTDLEAGRQAAEAPRIALIGRCVSAIRRFLEDLLAGDPNQPLRLFDLYGQIAEARGLPPPPASDLFFPDLSSRPQLPALTLASDGPAQLKIARTRYQKGLLGFIKAPTTPIGPLELKLASQMAASADGSPTLRGFWWAAGGFFAALGEKSVNATSETKSLCTRIDQQLRQQSDGSRAVPEKLMRDVLFQVAIAKSKNADILAIKEAYGLAGLIPSAEAKTVSQAAQLEPFLKRLKEIATASEEAWNKFCTGSSQAINTFNDATTALDQGAERLAHTDFRRLIRAVGSAANWIREDPSRNNESVALEIATGVLLIGNGIDNFTRLDADFVHQVDVMVARLQACISGSPMPQGGEVPVLDEMTRRAQEKLLVTQVVKEIQSSLGQIEQVLDTYFREPEQKEALASCQKPISQIVGALSILGHQDAVTQLQDSARRIAGFQAADYQANQQDFEQVARQLSGLGFFVVAMQSGVTDYRAFIDHLEVKPSKVEAAAEQLAAQPEAPAPAATTALTLDIAEPDHAATLVFGNLDSITPAAPEAAPLPSTTAPIPALPAQVADAEPEIDAELLEIFLEEGNEVMETIGTQLEALRARPADVDALTTLRRAFHTLKGSSRMVGLMAFGDIAWAIEQVHNLWLRQEKPVDSTLLQLVENAQQVFSAWIGHLEGKDEALPDTSALVAQAEQLKGSEAAPAQAPAATPTIAPAVPATLADSETPEPLEISLETAPEISFALELPVLDIQDLDSDQNALRLDDVPIQLHEVDTAGLAVDIALPEMAVEQEAPTSIADVVASPEPEIEPVAAELDRPAFDHQDQDAEPVEPTFAEEPLQMQDVATEDVALEATPSEALATPDESSSRAPEDQPLDRIEPAETGYAAETSEADQASDIDTALAALDLEFEEDLESVSSDDETPIPAVDVATESIALEISPPDAPALLAIEDESADETASVEVAAEELQTEDVESIDLLSLIAPLATSEQVVAATTDDQETVDTADFELEGDTGEDEAIATSESEETTIEAAPEDKLTDELAFDLIEAPAIDEALEEPTTAVDDDLLFLDEIPSESDDAAIALSPTDEFTAALALDLAEAPAMDEANEEATAAATDELLILDEAPVAAEVAIEPMADEIVASASMDNELPFADPATELRRAEQPILPATQKITVAPTLYQIFLEEAHIHIDTLQRTFGELEIDPEAPTPTEMLRAAHTLGSISGTVGFQNALKLGHGVEAALLRREKSGNPASLEALETLRIAIAELEGMLHSIEQQQSLRDPTPLLAQIEDLYPGEAAETIEAAASTLANLEHQAELDEGRQEQPLPEDEIDHSLLPIFIEEAADLVSGINERMAMWAGNPYDTDSIHALTRLLHTLKGSARMAGAMRLGALTHRLESNIESAHRAGGADPVLIAALQCDFDDIAEMAEHLGETPPQEASTSSACATDETAEEILAPIDEVLEEEAVLAVGEAFAAEAAPAPDEISIAVAPEVIDAKPAHSELDLAFDECDAEPLDISFDEELPVAEAVSTHETVATKDESEEAEDNAGLAETAILDLSLGAELLAATSKRETEASSADVAIKPADTSAESLPQETADELSEFNEFDELAEIEILDPSQHEAQAENVLDFDFDAPTIDLQKFSTDAALAAPAAELTQDAAATSAAGPEDHLDPDLLPIFLEEAVEIVVTVYEQLDAWQAAPADGAATHELARALHTLKGSARMAGAMSLGAMTHALESRAEEAAKSGAASAAVIGDIRHGFDAITQVIDRLQRGESMAEIKLAQPDALVAPTPAIVPPPVTAAVVSEKTTPAVAKPRPPVSKAPAAVVAPAATAAVAATVAAQRKDTDAAKAMLRIPAGLIDNLVNDAGELSIARARIEGEMRSLKQSLLDLTENVIRLRRQLREIEIQAESQMQSRTAVATDGAPDFDPLELDRFTRFQEVTRMMAESVNDVATVQLNLLKNLDEANAGLAAQARLNRELQQALMSVRMVPFSSITERLNRIVRQTAKELNKRAELEVQGANIELDQNVINKMIGPLEHLLRNAISHGVEAPELRVEHGKDEAGHIKLSLKQEGNEVIVTMIDDGAGLNFSRIREKAIANGLLSASDPYDERRLTEMIFQSGFSTAAQVSQIAGRGVGMDVVMTEVTNLGGRIDVTSESGKGSTFRIYLPLTLAVTNAVIVRIGSRYFAIPAAMIDQVREVREAPLAEMREAGGTEWLGNFYPFHFLPHLLGEPRAVPESRRMYWLLYLHSGLQRVVVQVDELQSTHEIVVKNIGPQLARVVGIAGATVMGDGRVILILNPVALAARAQVTAAYAPQRTETAADQAVVDTTGEAAAPTPTPEAPVETINRLPTVLVVDDSLTVRKITSRLLAREGYQVFTAKDGQDALEQMVELIPDVILSDIEMPRMDGFELARNIRNDARLVNIPVVMISSRTADKHRSHAAELGVDHFLGKPYQEEELLGLISGFIAQQRAGQRAG